MDPPINENENEALLTQAFSVAACCVNLDDDDSQVPPGQNSADESPVACPVTVSTEAGNIGITEAVVPILNKNVSILPPDKLTDGQLEKVICFLNYGDLMASRRVCHQWNKVIIASDKFLLSTILNLTLQWQNVVMITGTRVPWRQAKLQFFDFDHNRPDQPFNPTRAIFFNIVRLEFNQCFVTWTSVKRYVSYSPNIQDLILSRCIVRDTEVSQAQVHPLTNLDEAACYRGMRSLTSFTIYDVNDNLCALTKLLAKINSFDVQGIVTLKIKFYPYTPELTLENMAAFFRALLEFLNRNCANLKNLILDLRSNDLLQKFCAFVFGPLEVSTRKLNLEVFKLTAPSPDTGDYGFYHDASQSLGLFLNFLDSQKNLKSLGFPHFANLSAYENRRLQILDTLDINPVLVKLRVPGQIYLRRSFFKSFTKIKLLYIGDKSGVGRGAFLNPTRFIFDLRGGVARRTCKDVLSLSTWAKINYDSGKLYHIIEKFPKLCIFEFDGMRPVLNDRDVQAIIKFLPMLRTLSITSCDFISDYGVTGIPSPICSDMYKLSTIYTESDKIFNHKFGGRQSISDLKGLQKLHLIGNSKLSDVGLSLGIRFLELKSLFLPWNERITDWGIKEIGRNNPSLQYLNMTAAMASTSLLGFTELVQTCPRIRRRQCRVHTIHMFQEDSISSPSLLTAILWDEASSLADE